MNFIAIVWVFLGLSLSLSLTHTHTLLLCLLERMNFAAILLIVLGTLSGNSIILLMNISSLYN